jgi:predicted amidohydrolase
MGIAPGDTLHVVAWRGLRLAVVTCLDIELPALAAALGERMLDLVLVPSMTHRPAGYHRVFGCAKARAVELQAIVAAVGVIGTLPDGTSHHSGAAVFLPCEEALGHTGVLAALGPLGDPLPGEDPWGPMLIARDLPVATVRALRAGAAEVWPGAWRADGIRIVED